MNKNFIYLLTLIFCLNFVFAYNPDNLIHYYTMNQYNGTHIKDYFNSKNITYTSNQSIIGNGLFDLDSSLNFTNYSDPSGVKSLNFIDSFGNQSWTFILWLYASPTAIYGSERLLALENATPTTYEDFYLYPSSSRTLVRNAGLNICSNLTYYWIPNSWNMYAITYNGSQLKAQVNGVQYCNVAVDLKDQFNSIYLGRRFYGMKIDEVSFWNAELSEIDLVSLYNSGSGKSISEILTSSGNTSNQQHLYNICVNIGITNTLCNNLTVFDDNSVYCPESEKDYCEVGECLDKQEYYNNLGITPSNLSYDGFCGFCQNECEVVNQTICYNDLFINTCKLSANGCYQYQTSYCGNKFKCVENQCVIKTIYGNDTAEYTDNETETAGVTSVTNKELWNGFFGINTDSMTNRMLIAIIVIVLCCVIGVGTMTAISNAVGHRLPSFMGIGIVLCCTILPIMYFSFIGFIPFWIITLFVIISGVTLATIARNSMLGQT